MAAWPFLWGRRVRSTWRGAEQHGFRINGALRRGVRRRERCNRSFQRWERRQETEEPRFEILEKDCTFSGRDDGSPVWRRTGLVVNLELSKTAGVTWNRSSTLIFF